MLAVLILGLQLLPQSALQDKYKIKFEVLKAPLVWKGDGYVVKADPPNIDPSPYLKMFESEWSLYPAEVFKKAKVKKVIFGVNISVDGQLRAAVPAFDGDTMYYDVAAGAKRPKYQQGVIHHEFFHMIDERMGTLTPDKEWLELNPKGFKYGLGGKTMRTKGVGNLTDFVPGFLTFYSTSAVEEDRAEFFSHAMIDAGYVAQRAARDPVIKAKLELLKRRLASFEPTMGASFWDGVANKEKTPTAGRR